MSFSIGEPFVDVNTLASWQEDRYPPVLLDVRFDTAADDPQVLQSADRLPDAIHVDINIEAAGESGQQTGRLPLPSITMLQRDARRWGIDHDSTVVVYDDGKATSAARLWWVLRWAGVEKAYILDGGYAAWKATGQPTTREIGLKRRGRIELTAGHLPSIGVHEALDISASGILIDLRAREAYEGQPSRAGTGHIPGAVSLPAAQLRESDGRVKSESGLRNVLGTLGVDFGGRSPIALYCGSGVASAYGVAALLKVGIVAPLFPGSWTEWMKDPGRPVATGKGRNTQHPAHTSSVQEDSG